MSVTFTQKSLIKLFVVMALVVGMAGWAGAPYADAGGKGANVDIVYEDFGGCVGNPDTVEICDFAAGRTQRVDTPSRNTLFNTRLLVSTKITVFGDVLFEHTQNVRFNRLDKDGVQHTLRSRLTTNNGIVECQTDIVVANGELRFERGECVPI